MDITHDTVGSKIETDEAYKFGPAKPVYLNFALKSFQKQVAYKFEYFVGVLNGLLFIFVFTSLWASIYQNPSAVAVTSFDKTSIISYAVFAMLIRISMTMDDGHTAGRVRTGQIAMDIIKPVNYFSMLLFEALGQSLFHWFARAWPVFLICLFAFDISLPKEALTFPLTALAWVNGYAILFMINFAFSLLAFWFVETFSFQLMKYGLFTLFSGTIAPIDFFPEWIMPIVNILPFQYILYVPTSILISHVDHTEAVRLIGFQLVWVCIMGLVCYKMWSAAKARLVSQGG